MRLGARRIEMAATMTDPAFLDADADRVREECGVFGIFGHPDAAAIGRSERAAAIAEVQGSRLRSDLRSKITFDALGWHMAERLEQTPLLAGDSIDVAFSIGQNDHPEYGGLELSLRDLKVGITTGGNAHSAAPSQR